MSINSTAECSVSVSSPCSKPVHACAVGRPPALSAHELTAMHRQYHAVILRRCRSLLRDEHAAQDAAQRVFIKLWRYGHSFRRADSQLGWLYRVAHRCCLDELRQRRIPIAQSSSERPAPAMGSVEDRDAARRLLDHFDERVQRVAVLRYCSELSHDEIAGETGWSRQTIHKKLKLVRERADVLRARLCGDVGDYA
jgi:RNA polymerase sigma-70 factor (ECF subfamily)